MTHTSAQCETLKSKTNSTPPTANPDSSMHMAKEEGKMTTILQQGVYNSCDSYAQYLN